MRTLLILLAASGLVFGQTTVYVRASGPSFVYVVGTGDTSPADTIQTSPAHGYSAGQYVVIGGVCTGTTASPLNGIVKVKAVVDSTHFTVQNYITSADIAPNGVWANCSTNGNPESVKWTGLLTAYTLGTPPLGQFDGAAGNIMRKLALGTTNGLTGIVGSGCPSACVLTIATSFDPTAMTPPVAVGNSFSVWNSSSTPINTQGGVGTGTPYTVASVSSSGWVSNPLPVSGASNGNYTANMNCGPQTVPDGTIGTSQNCTIVSLLAYTGNPFWDNQVSGLAYLGFTGGNGYKLCWDGGNNCPNIAAGSVPGDWAAGAFQFMVDKQNAYLASAGAYIMSHIEGACGVNFYGNSTQAYGGTDDFTNWASYDFEAIPFLYYAWNSLQSTAVQQSFLGKILNDIDDPTAATIASFADFDANTAGHADILGSGTAVAATATTITLASGTVGASGALDYAVVTQVTNGGEAFIGIISDYNASTKVATLSPLASWLTNPTYASGGSASGTGTCNLTFSGGGTGAAATVAVASGVIGSTITVTAMGSGYSGAMTSATLTSGTATCSGTATISVPSTFWYGTAPTTGSAYTVYAGGITTGSSSSSPGSAGTITGYGTHFTSYLHAGDAVVPTYGWNWHSQQYQVYVVSVNSDTSLTTWNTGNSPTGVTPAMLWYMPQWKTGDMGYIAYQKHSSAFPGAQNFLYPPDAGSSFVNDSGLELAYFGGNTEGNMWAGQIGTNIALAPADSRAVRNLAIAQSAGFDFNLAFEMSAWTGLGNHGSYYSMVSIGTDFRTGANELFNSFPTYPSTLDVSGPWLMESAWDKIYNNYPDIRYYGSNATNHEIHPVAWGTENGLGLDPFGSGDTPAYVSDQHFVSAPLSTTAQYLKFLLSSVGGDDLWTGTGVGHVGYGYVMNNDPRIFGTSFYSLPHQYFFSKTSAVACASLTGQACSTHNTNFGVVSRTGLSAHTDGLLYIGARAQWNIDHSIAQGGVYSYYKVGELLNDDMVPPGGDTQNGPDETASGFMLQFGGDGSNVSQGETDTAIATGTLGYSTVDRWASANHGANDPVFGDQNSNYMYMSMDLSGVYHASAGITFARRNEYHSKQSGGDEFIFHHDETAVSSPIQIETHIHYTQNGETGISAYPEGLTTCPGTGGCGSLNSNRWMQELEDGGQAVNLGGATSDPVRQYGIVTNFLDPAGNTNTVNYDGTSYPGASGHTDRISVCAGSSCGGTASVFETVIVHKIANSLTDTTLTTLGINPDANWTGAQACGAVSCAVYLGARGGITHATMTGFNTTHSGTAQYLFGGLTAGTYTVTKGGTPVSGSPFTVAAGDTSIEFLSASGAFSINGSTPPATGPIGTMIGSGVKLGTGVIIH